MGKPGVQERLDVGEPGPELRRAQGRGESKAEESSRNPERKTQVFKESVSFVKKLQVDREIASCHKIR